MREENGCKTMNGSFTISLDFELYWGVRDKRTVVEYRQNLLGVWEIIPSILELFQKYDVHATWATVGFLFLENKKEFYENKPKILPEYEERKLCPYTYFNGLESLDFSSNSFMSTHFAKKLIKKIALSPYQEIATHTYSHYYTREPISKIDAFENDLNTAVLLAENNDIEINSLVFPRNQIDNKSFDVLKNVGIKVFRGNPNHWAYKDGEVEKTFLQRIYRFVDIYINLSGAHLSLPIDIKGIKEVKNSMFFRSFSRKFYFLEWLKMRRVKNAMTESAKNNKNFHLWWHPHNFGVNQKENLKNLEDVLKHFKVLENKYGMVSLNMQELGDYYEEKL